VNVCNLNKSILMLLIPFSFLFIRILLELHRNLHDFCGRSNLKHLLKLLKGIKILNFFDLAFFLLQFLDIIEILVK